MFDAGCGSGYGSAYLADHGARSVEAFDISSVAIEFDQKHFIRENLHYQVMSLEEINAFPDRSFDLIYSSNVLEHVPQVVKFFAHSSRILKPDGEMIIAVPPVVNELSRQNNINNRYHLNIWTPRQWYSVISQFYEEVEPYCHTFDRPDIILNFDNTPQETRVTEKDFTFKKCQVEELYIIPLLTIIFIARKPKCGADIPAGPMSYIENSFTRPYAEPSLERSSSSLFTKGGKAVRALRTFLKKKL